LSVVIEFTIGERVVGTTRSTRQATIRRILDRLANAHVGCEVSVHYPEDTLHYTRGIGSGATHHRVESRPAGA
jgi:hypothetical protein